VEALMTGVLFLVSSAGSIVMANGSSREVGVFATDALSDHMNASPLRAPKLQWRPWTALVISGIDGDCKFLWAQNKC
jgi:hypothetical protein